MRVGNACSVAPIGTAMLVSAGVAVVADIDLTNLTAKATAMLGLAGLVGASITGGIIFAIRKYDEVTIGRQKLYDEANKASLAVQLEEMKGALEAKAAESLENQNKMRKTLHDLANEAQLSKGENYELRQNLTTMRNQFLDLSKQLHETDGALHEANKELRTARDEMYKASRRLEETLAKLDASEKERATLTMEVLALRKGYESNVDRIGKLESVPTAASDSGGHPVVPAAAVPA